MFYTDLMKEKVMLFLIAPLLLVACNSSKLYVDQETFENHLSTIEGGQFNFAEMKVDEYRAALNILESLRDGKEIDIADLIALNMSAEDFNADIKDNVMQYIESLGYELKDICVVMEQFYNQRDQNSDWIQFEAW